MRFTELALDPRLQQAIVDRGYTDLTPVQELTLADRSGPGCGRPIPDGHGQDGRLSDHPLFPPPPPSEKLPPEGPRHRPTRELAVQIEGEALLLKPADRAPDRLLLRRRRLHRPAGPDQGRAGHHHRDPGAAPRPGREEAPQLQGVRVPRHRRGRPALRHGLPAGPPGHRPANADRQHRQSMLFQRHAEQALPAGGRGLPQRAAFIE